MKGSLRRLRVATVVGCAVAILVAPSYLTAPRPEPPLSGDRLAFERATAPLHGSSLGAWSQPGDRADSRVVGTVPGPDGRAVECVSLPPAPQSYRVTYLRMFRAGEALTARVQVRSFDDRSDAKPVLVRLRRGPGEPAEPLAARLSERELRLGRSWAVTDVEIPSGSMGANTVLSSLSIVNPSAERSIDVCVADAAVFPTSVGPAGHVDDPWAWFSMRSPGLLERIASILASGVLAAGAVLAVSLIGTWSRRFPASVVAAVTTTALGLAVVPTLIGALVAGDIGRQRYAGIFGHPNLLAASAVALAIAVLAWAPRKSVWRWIAVVLALVSIVLTGSRAGAFLLAFATFLLWRKSARRRTAVGDGIGRFLPLAAAVAAGLAAMLVSVAIRGPLDGGRRSDIMGTALQQSLARPLGWGDGMAGPVLGAALGPDSGFAPGHAHNLVLNVAVEFGLPAAVVLATLLAWWLVHTIRSRDLLGMTVALAAVALASVDMTIASIYVFGPLVLAGLAPRSRDPRDRPSGSD